jgi:hypothetical protein
MSFCHIKKLDLHVNQQYALSAKGKQWGVGEVIDIAFIGGTSQQRKFTIEVAEEWLKYANISFNWVSKLDKSDVRISFSPNLGSWSYVGTDCLFIPKTTATMNLGQLTKSTILHEFGHMLGLLHEHQNPKGGIKWNRDAVIKSLSGPPNNWDVNMIEHNVLNVANSSNSEGTDFDHKSIMLYGFPDDWTTNGKGTQFNNQLSDTDIQYIQKLYPKTNTITTPRNNTVTTILRKLGLKK